MVHSRLKIISKSVAIAARFLPPLLLLVLFTFSDIIKLNEFKVSKFIFEGFCNNENMDGFGRIVCPIVPIEDPFLNNGRLFDTDVENNLPLLVSTTKLRDTVVINSDSSSPSSLYLILEVCNTYRNNNTPTISFLEELCTIIKDSAKDSVVNYRFKKSDSNTLYNRELLKWKNIVSVLQRLPSSGKLPHIRLLSSLNKTDLISKVLICIANFEETHEGVLNTNTSNNKTVDLFITTDILSTSENPFRLLAETAFPDLLHNRLGTIQDSIHRLFMSFPEASAALLHMRRIGFDNLDFSSFEPQVDRFTFLAVFLSSLQLLLTYSFEPVHLYNGIIESSYNNKTTYRKFRYSYFLKEFTKDTESKIFVENIIRKLSSFVVNLNIKKKLFLIGDTCLRFTKKFLMLIIPLNITNKIGNNCNLLTKKLGEGLISLGKFISFDSNNDGFISFEEFTKGSIDMNDFVSDMISVVDSYNKTNPNKSDDTTLQFVNLLKSQNTLYDKIIDEFIISDTDKNDSLSLDEFIDLGLSTSLIENIHA